jgi:hypothetical protein
MMKKAPRKSRVQWQALINQQMQSDLSIANFCREQKLSESSFFKWKSIFGQEPKGFSRLSVKAPMTSGKIRCVLPNGLRLEWDESVDLNILLPIVKGLL